MDALNVPNLDCMPENDLVQAEAVFVSLGEYARLSYLAKRERLAGRIVDASTLERRMDAIYNRLPAWARW